MAGDIFGRRSRLEVEERKAGWGAKERGPDAGGRERAKAGAWAEGWLTCGPRWQADGAGALAWARGERVGELGRACLLGRARGRVGLIAGQAGMEPGRVHGKGKGPWGKDGLVCFGFGSSFQFYFFSISKQNKSI